MSKFIYKNIIHSIFLLCSLLPGFLLAQNEEVDTMSFSLSEGVGKYTLFLDDTYFVAGGALSGIYYSNNFKHLSYTTGYFIGVEQYFPLPGKLFANAGLNFSNRPFLHNYSNESNIRINNYFIDLPISTAYELPTLRNMDLRLILGLFGSLRLGSSVSESYPGWYIDDAAGFIYETSEFKRTDFGWVFGASMEYKNYLIRLRCFSGWNNLQIGEQGMLNSFTMDFGYFFFRDQRTRK